MAASEKRRWGAAACALHPSHRYGDSTAQEFEALFAWRIRKERIARPIAATTLPNTTVHSTKISRFDTVAFCLADTRRHGKRGRKKEDPMLAVLPMFFTASLHRPSPDDVSLSSPPRTLSFLSPPRMICSPVCLLYFRLFFC